LKTLVLVDDKAQNRRLRRPKLRLLTLDSLILTIPLDLELMEALMSASENRLPCYSVVLEPVRVWRVVYVLNNRYRMLLLK